MNPKAIRGNQALYLSTCRSCELCQANISMFIRFLSTASPDSSRVVHRSYSMLNDIELRVLSVFRYAVGLMLNGVETIKEALVKSQLILPTELHSVEVNHFHVNLKGSDEFIR